MPRGAAELVLTGAELLDGRTRDVNAPWLAGELRRIGIAVRGIRVVGDEEDAIAGAVRAAAGRAGIVIVSGGLGPTADDRTRGGVASAFGRPLRLDREALGWIEAACRRRGRPIPEGAEVQALLPEGARPLPNPVGAAPGLELACEGARIFVLPGVPEELRAMFREAVAPVLGRGREPEERVFRFFGVPEAEIDAAAGRALAPEDRQALSICARDGVITLRIPAAVAARSPGLEAALGEERIGRALFARDDRSLAEVLVEALAARGATVATAESCTGGGLAWAITGVPGASRVFERGWIVYANEAKTELLGVPAERMARHGAVSEFVARALAEGAADRARATVGVGITGIAGPTGGTPAKPVGLVYLAARPAAGRALVRRSVFAGDRDRVRRFAIQSALDLARRALLGVPP